MSIHRVDAAAYSLWQGVANAKLTCCSCFRYRVRYPKMYASKENCPRLTDEDANTFNCIQRAHQNSLEMLPIFLALLICAGLKVCHDANAPAHCKASLQPSSILHHAKSHISHMSLSGAAPDRCGHHRPRFPGSKGRVLHGLQHWSAREPRNWRSWRSPQPVGAGEHHLQVHRCVGRLVGFLKMRTQLPTSGQVGVPREVYRRLCEPQALGF